MAKPPTGDQLSRRLVASLRRLQKIKQLLCCCYLSFYEDTSVSCQQVQCRQVLAPLARHLAATAACSVDSNDSATPRVEGYSAQVKSDLDHE